MNHPNTARCRNCKWSHGNHLFGIAVPLTCGKFQPVRKVKAVAATTTFAPDRCTKCKEPWTPYVTLGAIKCKCDEPRMPRSLIGKDSRYSNPAQSPVRATFVGRKF